MSLSEQQVDNKGKMAITICLGKQVAEFYSKGAQQLGLTSAQMIEYTLIQKYAETVKHQYESRPPVIQVNLTPAIIPGTASLGAGQSAMMQRQVLLMQAQQGALTCKNCTMRLTVKEVEDNRCNKCGAQIIDDPTEDLDDEEDLDNPNTRP